MGPFAASLQAFFCTRVCMYSQIIEWKVSFMCVCSSHISTALYVPFFPLSLSML